MVARGELDSHHLLPAARGQILSRMGRRGEAAAAFRRALELVGNDAKRRFLQRELRRLVEPGEN